MRSGENPLGYFPFLCSLDSEEEIDIEEAWEKANPSIEFLPVLARQIKSDYLKMKQMPSLRMEFVSKRMNLTAKNIESSVTSWENILRSSYSDIENKISRSLPDLSYKSCIIGIDYADVRDFASAGLLFKVNGEYIWRQHTWICRNNPFFENIKFPFANFGQEGYLDFEIVDTPTISIQSIIEWVVEQMKNYSLMKIVMDTYRFSLFKTTFEMFGIDIETKKNQYGLVRMIRRIGSINAMVVPKIEKAFEEDNINIGNSAIMRWYINNSMIEMDKNGNKNISKVEPKLRKNDGFSSFSIAMQAEELLDEIIIVVN